MITSYTFSEQYVPAPGLGTCPSFRLLEGGRFFPGDFAPVLIADEGELRLKYLQWGFSQSVGHPGTYPSLIPAERLAEAASVQPLHIQPCLIPLTSFRMFGAEHPLHPTYQLKGNHTQSLTMAAICRTQRSDDGSLRAFFSILTVPVPDSLQATGRRIPMLLSEKAQAAFLSGAYNWNQLLRHAIQFADTQLSYRKVEELRDLTPVTQTIPARSAA